MGIFRATGIWKRRKDHVLCKIACDCLRHLEVTIFIFLGGVGENGFGSWLHFGWCDLVVNNLLCEDD